MFQSYQFMQINPDVSFMQKWTLVLIVFQSYQFMQINPDDGDALTKLNVYMVSIVSIHADQSRPLNGLD